MLQELYLGLHSTLLTEGPQELRYSLCCSLPLLSPCSNSTAAPPPTSSSSEVNKMPPLKPVQCVKYTELSKLRVGLKRMEFMFEVNRHFCDWQTIKILFQLHSNAMMIEL